MFSCYIITGAAGHLGGALLRLLESRDCEIRGLVLPGEKIHDTERIRCIEGDITKPETLNALFEGIVPEETALIHTAGIVDISGRVSSKIWEVNVCGTKNIISKCKEYGLKRLVYVSSVHAIPEKRKGVVLSEVDAFSPDLVSGVYAKTKAAATREVLGAVKDGVDAVVVHPSGIIGPYDDGNNHLVQMVKDYIVGRIPACVKGGYDFVDVRDVAEGCVSAAENGQTGSCYILSNNYCEVKDLFSILRELTNGKKLPILPIWMAKIAAPAFEWSAQRKKTRPLYTSYSLLTLSGRDRFTHLKASNDLKYKTRDFKTTVKDTVAWLKRSKEK